MSHRAGATTEGLQLEMACDLASVRPATEALREYLRNRQCAEADVIDCELAAAEACNNAVSYARPEARDLPIRLEVNCTSAEITIQVGDHTGGFCLPDKPVLPDLDSEGGRGLFVILSVMKAVKYHQFEGGNTLIMIRQRTV